MLPIKMVKGDRFVWAGDWATIALYLGLGYEIAEVK